MDVFESQDAYLVLAEVPGMNPGDIEVVVDRNHLRLSGARQLISPQRYRVHQAEIEYGSFQRVFRFPGPVTVDQVTASYDNGLLTITLPKEPIVQTSVKIR
jgi:HSP20 family protein